MTTAALDLEILDSLPDWLREALVDEAPMDPAAFFYWMYQEEVEIEMHLLDSPHQLKLTGSYGAVLHMIWLMEEEAFANLLLKRKRMGETATSILQIPLGDADEPIMVEAPEKILAMLEAYLSDMHPDSLRQDADALLGQLWRESTAAKLLVWNDPVKH